MTWLMRKNGSKAASKYVRCSDSGEVGGTQIVSGSESMFSASKPKHMAAAASAGSEEQSSGLDAARRPARAHARDKDGQRNGSGMAAEDTRA